MSLSACVIINLRGIFVMEVIGQQIIIADTRDLKAINLKFT